DAVAVVTFYGEDSEETKRRLFARSEIFILSSPREGFSIATLEAMAQGCAAVVVNDPQKPNGVLDFVRDREQGLVVAPGLPSMMEALRSLLRDPELRLVLRRKAWQAAQGYTIEMQARRLLAFYGETRES
ncbi:MAG TPA: glycosyltransferase family 4 protein, partial [Candidatus Methylacidiphilales bacterium]